MPRYLLKRLLPMSGQRTTRRRRGTRRTLLAAAAGAAMLTPLAGHAAAGHAAKVCLDNGSAGEGTADPPGQPTGSANGSHVASRPHAALPPSGVYALPASAIDALRAWTAEFPDPAAAVAAGRTDLGLCFDMMGSHYADP